MNPRINDGLNPAIRHYKRRLYKCDECQHSFGSKQNLDTHPCHVAMLARTLKCRYLNRAGKGCTASFREEHFRDKHEHDFHGPHFGEI